MSETPETPPAGWRPTTSTVMGAAAGGALAQVAIAVLETLSHQLISSQTAGAISTLCVLAVGYFFPDGGRK